jgi:cell division FtsZ-interacting protein ZapD
MTQQQKEPLGQLEPGEHQALRNLQSTERELTFRIGQYTREILSMSMQAGEVNQQIQMLLTNVRQRFDIPEGKQIRLLDDGTLHLWEGPSKQE